MESQHLQCLGVLIPDLWGKSSDGIVDEMIVGEKRLNPRFVGQVFRRGCVKALYDGEES